MRGRLAGVVLVAALGACAGGQATAAPAATSTSTATATASSLTPAAAPPPSAPPTPDPTTSAAPKPAPAGLDRSIAMVPGAVQVLGPPPGAQADVRPARVAPVSERFALLVGITGYRPPTHDTIGGANDVRLWRRMLLDAGWQPQNVHVLVDDRATGAALRTELRWLAARSRPGTFTLFHWSGHVRQRGGGREALWPVDRDFVDDRAVEAVLRTGAGRMWVDVAGCEAGSFAGRLPGPRVLFTGASTASQKAYEYPPWGLSVWTGLLLEHGTRERRADADGDGRVSVGEAVRYATYYAQGITLTQRPYGRQTPVALGDPQRGWTLADPPA